MGLACELGPACDSHRRRRSSLEHLIDDGEEPDDGITENSEEEEEEGRAWSLSITLNGDGEDRGQRGGSGLQQMEIEQGVHRRGASQVRLGPEGGPGGSPGHDRVGYA